MDIIMKDFKKIIPKYRKYTKAAVWFSRKRKQLIFSEELCIQLDIKPGDRVDVYRNEHSFIMKKSSVGLFTIRYYNKKVEDKYTSCCLAGNSVLLEIGTYIDDDVSMHFTILENGDLLFKQWGGEDDGK